MRFGQWMGVCITAGFLASTPLSNAIPAFARQYGTSCSTCHLDFPKLNDFGKAFKDAGFKFPKDDETFLKVPPVMLGAPAQKDVWPHTIYPGTLPGLPPISFRFATFFQVYGQNRNAFRPPDSTDPTVPKTDFQPGTFTIISAGNFGSGIAFWIDQDFSVGGDNTAGGLGDAYMKFHDISRFLKMPQDSLNLRFGQFEIDLPFSQARSWNLSGWDIYDEANIGAMNGLVPGVNNGFAFSSGGQGAELSGGHTYGGYHYSLAFINQNTTGTTASGDGNAPQIGIFSDANFKDLYGRFQYRFNLDKDASSRNQIQAAGPTGPRDHTYLTLGGYYFYGRSVQRVNGETTTFVVKEPFYRTGGDFSFNYRNFNLFGLWMYGHDQNIGLNATGDGLTGGMPAHFNGGFLEADYLVYPWMMAIMRWDRVQSQADFVNGQSGSSTNFFSPASTSRDRITPGVQFLIRPNIKAAFEYQVRPRQQVFDETGTATGGPFRNNTAVIGLDWVY